MPKLIQNISGSLVQNLKDTVHTIKFIESKFGYGDYFELGYYEAFIQDFTKINGSEDLNKNTDFGLSININSEFKPLNVE